MLISILKRPNVSSAIIFTRTKHRTKKLATSLYKVGHNVTSLQGNLSQNRRQEAMLGFRKGKYNIMVATDIAARGLDISAVSHVINFDVPDTTEAYTHRIGRTGRASKTGEAYTFVTPEDNKKVKAIERSLEKKVPKILKPDSSNGIVTSAHKEYSKLEDYLGKEFMKHKSPRVYGCSVFDLLEVSLGRTLAVVQHGYLHDIAGAWAVAKNLGMQFLWADTYEEIEYLEIGKDLVNTEGKDFMRLTRPFIVKHPDLKMFC